MPSSYQFVLIAVGGTGAKVAQALVNLLTVGFPMLRKGDDARPRSCASANDVLKIWRLDPDGQNGGATALDAYVDDYHSLQRSLGLDPEHPAGNGLFSLKVESPLTIDPTGDVENTLRRILNTQAHEELKHVLRLFYSGSDLDLDVRRGFYQKPFIGSAVLANPPRALLSALGECRGGAGDRETRFFVCGSLFGGTGAAGVPVVGRLLKGEADASWKIGAAVLGPYFTPPAAPLLIIPPEIQQRIAAAVDVDLDSPEGELIVRAVADANPGTVLSLEEVGQVLGHYFADPGGAAARAATSLIFYLKHGADCFDRLYYLENPHRTDLGKLGVPWCNGGANQRNPAHAVEYVAALAALDFFVRPDPAAGTTTRKEIRFDVPVLSREEFQGELCLADLPVYGGQDPLRWFTAACLALQVFGHHLGVTWDMRADQLKGTGFALLERSFGGKPREWAEFQRGTGAFFGSVAQAIRRMSPAGGAGEGADLTRRAVGWAAPEFEQALTLLDAVRPLPDSGGGLFRAREPEPIRLGQAHAVVKLNADVKTIGAQGAGLGTQPALEFATTLWGMLLSKVTVAS